MYPSLSLRQLDVTYEYNRHTLQRLRQLFSQYSPENTTKNHIDRLITKPTSISQNELGQFINSSIQKLVLEGHSEAGLTFGNSFNIKSLSGFNIALQSAPNLGQAILLISRYCPLIESSLQLEFCSTDSRLYISYRSTPSQSWLYEDALSGCWQLIQQLAATPVSVTDLQLAIPEPSHSECYRDYFPIDVHFDAPSTYIQLSQESWLTPMAVSAQPVTDLFEFWLDIEPTEHQAWLVNIYRYVVDTMTTDYTEPTLTALAERQNCSLATMKRRLAREGKNFTQIKDEIKMMICYHYLTMTSLPISMISEWTGFTSATNFSRACKRWFGESPRNFRHRNL